MAFTEDDAAYLKSQPLGRIVLSLLIVVGTCRSLRLRAPALGRTRCGPGADGRPDPAGQAYG
jgi:hypothetical protein